MLADRVVSRVDMLVVVMLEQMATRMRLSGIGSHQSKRGKREKQCV